MVPVGRKVGGIGLMVSVRTAVLVLVLVLVLYRYLPPADIVVTPAQVSARPPGPPARRMDLRRTVVLSHAYSVRLDVRVVCTLFLYYGQISGQIRTTDEKPCTTVYVFVRVPCVHMDMVYIWSLMRCLPRIRADQGICPGWPDDVAGALARAAGVSRGYRTVLSRLSG